MRFIYGKADWKNTERGIENGFLLTNGLGGFCAQTVTGANARNDQAVLMGCTEAPTKRINLVNRIEEELWIDNGESCGKVSLSSQQYVDCTKNAAGEKYLQSFVYDIFPEWVYQAGGVEVVKTMAMAYGENTVAVRYRVSNRGRSAARVVLTPLFQFTEKGARVPEGKRFSLQCSEQKEGCCGAVSSEGVKLYFGTDFSAEAIVPVWTEDFYYAHDSRDGRNAVGRAFSNHRLTAEVAAGESRELEVAYSLERNFLKEGKTGRLTDELQKQEKERLEKLLEQAGLKNECARELVRGADQFVVGRDSTKGKTIIAGYPFFADWGRDTMIALTGCCLSTGRFEDAKNIFLTFMKHCRRGLMPNMFPENGKPPIYNTADASLLFIGAVYEYFLRTEDVDFIKEAFPVIEDIINWYKKGTDFHIFMDGDGLISAGADMEQVTWMDVRCGDILPTPRHGKAVEINAYWYNALCVAAELAQRLGQDGSEWKKLSDRVKKSFCASFWNEEENCLYDVLPTEEANLCEKERQRRQRAKSQVRCNQIWAVSQRFCMLEAWQEKAVTDRVFESLYTPWGLRSLAQDDIEFHPHYGGSMKQRDMAYHQGTVWAFPLGAYYLAYLKVNGHSIEAKETVYRQLAGLEGALREGCAGQLAEVYDGEDPNESEGCFAQAWSTAELLRVYEALEKEKPAKKRRGRRTKRKEEVERQQAGKPEPKAEAEEKTEIETKSEVGAKTEEEGAAQSEGKENNGSLELSIAPDGQLYCCL
ncbi:MAG: amylo-alpha-1,6-glucosidase [Eisenbergiella sp.]